MRRVCLVAATITTFGVIAWWRLSGPAIAQGFLCPAIRQRRRLRSAIRSMHPAGTGNRSGDLNGTVWGVSHILECQFRPGTANAAAPTSLVGCNGISTVLPPHDVIVCNGQLRECTCGS